MSGRRHAIPQTLAGDVRSELARLGAGPQGADMLALTAAWAERVGEAIAAHAWPARIGRDGTLHVHASSSAWAFELGCLEETIRERLGELAPPRLRFTVGPLPSPGAESVPDVRRDRTGVTPEERARGEEIAREIEDPDLREAVARAAAASLAAASRRVGPTAPSDRLRGA